MEKVFFFFNNFIILNFNFIILNNKIYLFFKRFQHPKREIPSMLNKILDRDVQLTRSVVKCVENLPLMKKLRMHYKMLEVRFYFGARYEKYNKSII